MTSFERPGRGCVLAASPPAVRFFVESPYFPARFPALSQHLSGKDGQIRRFIIFYVNEEDIRFLGNDKCAFQEGYEMPAIPSIAGG